MKPDIHRLLELQKLLADFNQVERMVHRNHLGTFVAENNTEHSYNLAMTGWFLAEWFPDLDKNKIITYSLVHDLVEIYAGDTYIYASAEEINSKAEREAKALARLEKEWGDFKDMTDAIQDYETKQNAEARFVYALDKVMPIMLAYIHDGYSWKKNKVTAEMLRNAKMVKVKLSPEILPYFEKLHKLLLERSDIIDKL